MLVCTLLGAHAFSYSITHSIVHQRKIRICKRNIAFFPFFCFTCAAFMTYYLDKNTCVRLKFKSACSLFISLFNSTLILFLLKQLSCDKIFKEIQWKLHNIPAPSQSVELEINLINGITYRKGRGRETKARWSSAHVHSCAKSRGMCRVGRNPARIRALNLHDNAESSRADHSERGRRNSRGGRNEEGERGIDRQRTYTRRDVPRKRLGARKVRICL